MLAKPIVCVFFSPTGILSLFIRYNDLFAGKTDTPFLFFGGDWWRVGLINKRNFFFHIFMLFLFFTADIYTFIYFTLFLKGFFI